jgi:tripartite-type tricarboxylate transporter receptor subunit TctC
MIVAFPPGGADDATARILQDPMQKALGQPIVIENVGGAGGMIAAAKAARAKPDGYTILLHQDALAAGMTLYPARTFDAEKDFVPIGLVNATALTLAGRPSLPPNNFDELLRWMKEPGQTVKVGHPGAGSFAHLVEVLMFQELSVKVTQVPYRGAGRRWSICWRPRWTWARSRLSSPRRWSIVASSRPMRLSAESPLPACRT